MKTILRNGLKVLLWLVGIFIILWMLIWAYVLVNKKKLMSQVITELNHTIKGEIKLGDLEPSLLSTFPNVSLRLSQVVVRDTMWNQHHHDLVNANKVFIRLQLFSLFSGNPEITKVIINDASIYLFSDSSGYSNAYLFDVKSKDSSGQPSNTAPKAPDLELRRVRLVIDQKDRGKLYDVDVRSLDCNTRNRDDKFLFDIRTRMLVHALVFNNDNGSFIKEKTLAGKFRLEFDKPDKKLVFNRVVMEVDDHPFTFSGQFAFGSKPPLYYLDISSKNIDYKRTGALLTNNISSKLDSFSIENPFNVRAIIDGRALPNRIPLVNIEAKVSNNHILTSFAEVTEASFTARFTNQLSPHDTKVDQNSGFYFTGFSGRVENIPCRSDSVTIKNLKHPIISCDIHADLDLPEINETLGTSIEFTKGRCKADLRYRGSVLEGDTASASIFGTIRLADAGIRYVPRNLLMDNCSGSIVFEDKDVFIKQLKTEIGNSQLVMNGTAKNLTSLIDRSPEKMLLSWNIASTRLNMGDFTSFLSRRSSAASKRSAKKRFIKLANRIDRMLNDCSVALQLNADRLIYKKFAATNLAASLQLTDRMLALTNVKVQHSGGSVTMNGSLVEEADNNRIRLKSNMENVDITKVFSEFNNFGQDGIIDKNLKGRLSADIDINGLVSSKAEVVENSLNGVVNISLKNGELNDFEPLKNISQVAFKNRDFSNIRFAELKEKLEVNGSRFTVNRMEIQSTVMTMFVEGIYDVKKGTDLSIQVPLSNLAKRGESFELKNKGVDSRTGVSVRLRAKTDENGKTKISWDPFRIALKKNSGKTVTDSAGKEIPQTPRQRRSARRNKE